MKGFREEPRTGEKSHGSEGCSYERAREEQKRMWGGVARVGLGGRSPPLLLGKRVGPDDALSPSPSRCDSWAPCAASLPAGGLGGRGSGLVP